MRNIFVFIIILLLAGCKGQERIVETVRTEYKDRLVEKVDTVSVKDSTFVYVKGDTLYIYKYRDRWREKIVRDTAYVVKTDSIEVPVYIEKKSSSVAVGQVVFIVFFLIGVYLLFNKTVK